RQNPPQATLRQSLLPPLKQNPSDPTDAAGRAVRTDNRRSEARSRFAVVRSVAEGLRPQMPALASLHVAHADVTVVPHDVAAVTVAVHPLLHRVCGFGVAGGDVFATAAPVVAGRFHAVVGTGAVEP